MQHFHAAEPRFDVERTLDFQRNGARDPTVTMGPQELVKTFALPDGRVVRHAIRRDAEGVAFEASGDGASVDVWAAQFPLADGLAGFAPEPRHIALRYIAREYPGLRLVRVPWLFDLACSIVLQQRVTYAEAVGEWAAIAARWGTRGELGLAFPPARALARVRPFELQALGIDARRAATLVRLATEVAVHGLFDGDLDPAALRPRLAALPGIGPWTTEMLAGFGLADPDAIPTGDLHLPHLVTSVFAGERRGSDERMLELLAPYRGQRFRVIRLLWAAQFHAPALLRRR